MLLKTQFPHLWFSIDGTFKRLSLLVAELQLSTEDRSLEKKRTEELLQESVDNMMPFATHFTHSLGLKAPNGHALAILKQRIEALGRLESRFDAATAANHTAFDLSSAWGANIKPEPADISYMELLLECLDLALFKAQAKGEREISKVIIAVKVVLAEFLIQYQEPDYTSEFYELQRTH